jgi:mono/diheme cytochrome c family protein
MLPFQRQPIVAALTLVLLSGAVPAVAEEDAVSRGEYLVRAGGCFSCHTVADEEKLAGGRALATPFGTFYSPNITPDPETGIGRWTDAQFLRALREGVRPDGANYFPVFPYPSFTGITDGDALAIKAYLFSFPPVHRKHLVAGIGLWRARSDRYRRAARFLTLGQSSCHSKRTKIAVITSRSSGTE